MSRLESPFPKELTEKDKREIIQLISSSDTGVTFSDRYLGDEHGKFIYDTIQSTLAQTDKCPATVEAKGCSQGLDSAVSLAALLKKASCKITVLNLEWNNLGNFESGLIELASALRINNSLTELDLRNNNIGQHGGVAIARALQVNKTLRSLDLRWNEIGNGGAIAFKELLKSGGNNSLTTLKLNGNKMTDSVIQELEDLIQRRETNSSSTLARSEGNPIKRSIADELHLANSRSEELEKELTKVMAESRKLKEENREQLSRNNLAHAKEIATLTTKIDSLEEQLNDSASKISSLEINAVREKDRSERLQEEVAKEQKEKDELSSSAKFDSENNSQKLLAVSREKQRLENELTGEKSMSASLREENEGLRDSSARREEELRKNLKEREEECSNARKELDKVSADLNKMKMQLDDALNSAEVAKENAQSTKKLLNEVIADREAKVAEAHKSVDEKVEAVKEELLSRLNTANKRAEASENKFNQSEIQRRKSEAKESANSVLLEQKLSEQAVKLREDFDRLRANEKQNLLDSLGVVKAQREAQDTNLSDLSLEVSNLQDAMHEEAKSARATIEKLSFDLTEALKEGRQNRVECGSLRLENESLKKVVEPLKKKLDSAEEARKKVEELRSRDNERMQVLLSNEREERQREAINFQKRFDDASEMLRHARDNLADTKTSHVKEMNRLEKGLVAAVNAIFIDRRQKSEARGKKKVLSPRKENN